MKKRSFFAMGAAVVVFAAVGLTFAINKDRSVLNNDFSVAAYQIVASETFTSPRNWETCESIPKTMTITNYTQTNVSVRILLEEDWIASDGTTHLPLISTTSGLTMAQINLTNNSGWTKHGNYYYYDNDLAPNATTTSLIESVELNCDANLDQTEDSVLVSDGQYSGAEYHLKIIAQTTQSDAANTHVLADMMASKVNNLGNYEINFTRKAKVSNSASESNGNGINAYTEDSKTIYYYRGEVDDNNVIWADICWKIVRTTATGGVKMIYNGEPTAVGATRQCNATGAAVYINDATYAFNNAKTSPADVGYMYGARIARKTLSPGSRVFTFSNDVSKNGNTYTLDTSTGQSISGTWSASRTTAATRYHYFCTDGTTSCDNTKIGYIHHYGISSPIYYLPVGGYTNIEAMKEAMFTNTNDSIAKSTIESWFETNNLDGHVSGSRNYENDLEDAVFCNDRSYSSGALKSKDESGESLWYLEHGSYARNTIKNAHDNIEPSLDCANPRDAFQASNNEAKLNHKIGLITIDELSLVGKSVWGFDATNYLYAGEGEWSASPAYYSSINAFEVVSWRDDTSSDYTDGEFSTYGLRPLVSLKAGTEFTSGTGPKTDPYIVE